MQGGHFQLEIVCLGRLPAVLQPILWRFRLELLENMGYGMFICLENCAFAEMYSIPVNKDLDRITVRSFQMIASMFLS